MLGLSFGLLETSSGSCCFIPGMKSRHRGHQLLQPKHLLPALNSSSHPSYHRSSPSKPQLQAPQGSRIPQGFSTLETPAQQPPNPTFPKETSLGTYCLHPSRSCWHPPPPPRGAAAAAAAAGPRMPAGAAGAARLACPPCRGAQSPLPAPGVPAGGWLRDEPPVSPPGAAVPPSPPQPARGYLACPGSGRDPRDPAWLLLLRPPVLGTEVASPGLAWDMASCPLPPRQARGVSPGSASAASPSRPTCGCCRGGPGGTGGGRRGWPLALHGVGSLHSCKDKGQSAGFVSPVCPCRDAEERGAHRGSC